MKTIFFTALALFLTLSLRAQTINATQTGEIPVDAPPAGKANANDEIRYKAVIQNAAGPDGTGVNFNAAPDARTTFQAGTFRSSPLALPDAYTCTGNVGINVPPANGVITNDFDDNIPGLTVTAVVNAPTTQGGVVTIAANGGFTYTPPAGFTGADNFTYTLNDSNPESGIPPTDAGTVTITVSNLIWFIDNSAAGGDGRLSTPFNSLAAFNAGSTAAADVVYLEHTGINYTDGIELANGERLIGEGHTGAANLSGVLSFALAPFSATLPNINGTRPVITSESGNGITLAQNNSVRGVNVANTFLSDISGSNFGTLTLSEVALSGAGKALDLATGTLAATFTGIASTSSATQGISLTSIAGTLAAGGASISGSANEGISVSNSSVTASFGNTSVSGSGGTGVNLQNNTGNLSFDDLDISPAANQRALYAVDNTGTITTTTGTISNSGAVAVEITKASGATPLAMSLTSVSASGAANGIVLNNTGGTFAVNGSGTTDGSGGTIQNITNRGAGFTNAAGITLKNMTFTNANTTDGGTCGASDNSGCNAAIHLDGVTGAVLDNVDITGTVQQGVNVRETSGFQLLNSTVTQNGDETEEGGLYARNIFGTASISNTTISLSANRCAVIYNTNKTLAMTVTGSTFHDTQASPVGADGIEMTSFGNSVTDLDITSCTFTKCRTTGVQFLTENTSQGTIDITSCTVDPQEGIGLGLDVVSNGTSTLKFNIADNPSVKARAGNVINCFAQGSSTMEGAVSGNTVSSYDGSGSGIRAVANVNSTGKIKIINNTVSNIKTDFGITCTAAGGTGRLDATITGNNVSILNTASYNIQVAAGASGSTRTNKICANVANNIVSPAPIENVMTANFHARASTPSHELLLQGPGPIATYWNSNGNAPASPTATVITTGTGIFTYNATCLLPSYP